MEKKMVQEIQSHQIDFVLVKELKLLWKYGR